MEEGIRTSGEGMVLWKRVLALLEESRGTNGNESADKAKRQWIHITTEGRKECGYTEQQKADSGYTEQQKAEKTVDTHNNRRQKDSGYT